MNLFLGYYLSRRAASCCPAFFCRAGESVRIDSSDGICRFDDVSHSRIVLRVGRVDGHYIVCNLDVECGVRHNHDEVVDCLRREHLAVFHTLAHKEVNLF